MAQFDDPIEGHMADAYDAFDRARGYEGRATRALLRAIAGGADIEDVAGLAAELHDIGDRLDALDELHTATAADWALNDVDDATTVESVLRIGEDARGLAVHASGSTSHPTAAPRGARERLTRIRGSPGRLLRHGRPG